MTHSTSRPPRYDAALGGWVVPAPTIDPQVILRSARAVERYGPDFSYGHYGVVPSLGRLAKIAGGLVGLAVAAQIPPVRRRLLDRMQPGQGPSEAQRASAWFNVRFVGEGGGERVVCEVSGGDPGYGETSKMLGEAALCLACDELPQRAGQLSPAAAMGDALLERLQAAGISFSVRDPHVRADAPAAATLS
jgi:short subunit dehydrogenase-like uncharacterized protein